MVWTIGARITCSRSAFRTAASTARCTRRWQVVAGVAWVNRDAADGDLAGVAVGTNNSTDFLRQAKVGDTITDDGGADPPRPTQQLWRVESMDQNGRLIAQGQVRLANLPPPEMGAPPAGTMAAASGGR